MTTKTYSPEEKTALAKISRRMKVRAERKQFKQAKKFASFKDYNNQDDVDLAFTSHIII